MSGFGLVVAMDAQRGIGIEGDLPWRLPADMAHFKRLTTETRTPDKQNAVIMGRKTWESIPPRFRPLPNRINVVLSRQTDYANAEGATLAPSLEQALSMLAEMSSVEFIFVIGGGVVYTEALQRSDCKRVFLTELEENFQCDTFFPTLPAGFTLSSRSSTHQENGVKFTFTEYTRT